METKSLAKNAIYKTILNICNIIIPIIVGPYVLRVLDREYYDLFNALNADFAIILVIGGFGIYTYGVREISRARDDKNKVNRLFTELFFIGIVTNILVMSGYLGVSFFLQDTKLKIYLCLILSIQFLGNIFNVEWINEANENYRFIAIKSILVRLLYFVSIFIFVKQADDIISYVLLMMGSTFLNTFISFIYITRNNKIVFKGLNFKRHIVPLFIIFVISNIAILYAQIDKVMLGAFVNDSSVTTYQIAQYISSLIYSLLMPIVIVALPRLSKLFVHNRDDCFELHTKVFNSFLIFAIPALVGTALLSREVILLYGGDKYLDCVEPLAIYCAAQLISAGCYIFGDALMYVTGNERQLLINNLIGGLINVSLNFLFVALGIFNTNYAVLTVLIAYFTVTLLDYIFIRRKIKYDIRVFNKHSILYIYASALFIPIILLVKSFSLNMYLSIGICVITCMLVYFGVLFAFKDSIFDLFCNSFKSKVKRVFRR